MNKRIFRSIFIVAIIILLASLAVVFGVLYTHYSDSYLTQLKNESLYIAQGIDKNGIDYFDNLPKNSSARVTWIDADGTVLYDSEADAATLENHSQREEVREALTSGNGESTRYSNTLSEQTIYYAVRLDDNTVLRISGSQHSVFSLLLKMLWPVLLILAAAIFLSALLASRLSKNIIKPINEIDLSNPEQAQTYDELAPLLRRIAHQNKQIDLQMEQLRQKQQEFSTITENMQEGLLVIDRKTDLLSYNSSAMRILRADEAVQNKSVLMLNRSESFRHAIDAALTGRHDEQLLQLNDKIYRLIANPVYSGDDLVGAVLVILDVTEKEQLDELRRQFTANVSHELKTPLTSISGFAEIIKNGIAKQEDIPRFAQNIYDESARLITLVNDIIRLSQLDEGSIPMEKEPVPLHRVVQDVLSRLQPAAQAKNVKITADIQSVSVFGVAQILDEMVYNLCDNAIKYNVEGGSVSVELKNVNGGACLTVRDTGIGIPKSDQQRVFERFYRVDKSHSKEIGGTGLGLSIVKHAALFHGATVTLESEPGKGTTVRVQF